MLWSHVTITNLIVSLRNNSAKPFHRIWDCMDPRNIEWQLDTFFICHQRDDNIEQIVQAIRSDKTQSCEACQQLGRGIRRCPQTKTCISKTLPQSGIQPQKGKSARQLC